MGARGSGGVTVGNAGWLIGYAFAVFMFLSFPDAYTRVARGLAGAWLRNGQRLSDCGRCGIPLLRAHPGATVVRLAPICRTSSKK